MKIATKPLCLPFFFVGGLVGWGCSPPALVVFTPSLLPTSPSLSITPSPPLWQPLPPLPPPLIPTRQRGSHLPNLLSQTTKGVNRISRWMIKAHLPVENHRPLSFDRILLGQRLKSDQFFISLSKWMSTLVKVPDMLLICNLLRHSLSWLST